MASIIRGGWHYKTIRPPWPERNVGIIGFCREKEITTVAHRPFYRESGPNFCTAMNSSLMNSNGKARWLSIFDFQTVMFCFLTKQFLRRCNSNTQQLPSHYLYKQKSDWCGKLVTPNVPSWHISMVTLTSPVQSSSGTKHFRSQKFMNITESLEQRSHKPFFRQTTWHSVSVMKDPT